MKNGEIRSKFALDSSSCTISAGTIKFTGNTLVVESTNFNLNADGTVSITGAFYSNGSSGNATIRDGNIHLSALNADGNRYNTISLSYTAKAYPSGSITVYSRRANGTVGDGVVIQGGDADSRIWIYNAYGNCDVLLQSGMGNGKATGYKYNSKANAANNTAIVAAALKTIEAAGYYGQIYCSRDFYLNYLERAKLAAYDVWEAAYTSKDTAAVVNGIWQYTSKGSVPGITGNVDLNVAYKDYPAIIKAAGLNGFTASKPTTDTAPALKTIKAGPMSAGDYKKHTAALAADGIAWEDC